MTARLSPQRETEMTPVGFYCDHSDEKPGARTHHDWEWVEGEGYVFRHLPDTISSHTSVGQLYLKPENRGTRCPRAVPVYTGPAVAAELAAVRAERDELAKRSVRAIHALKSPAPEGSAHYRSGWDTGLEAAMDAVRGVTGEAAS